MVKVAKCHKTTEKYGLDQWKESKDLTDLTPSGRRRATTPKQDEQIVSLDDREMFATSHNIENHLKGKRAKISQRIIQRQLHEAGAKYSPSMSRPLLTEDHRKDRLK